MNVAETNLPALAPGVHHLEGPAECFASITSAIATTSMLSVNERANAAVYVMCGSCKKDFEKFGSDSSFEQCPTCGSKTIRFCISPESNRHWLRIKEQLAKTTPELHEPEPTVQGPIKPAVKTNWRILLAALLGGTILFYALRHWLYSAPIPFIHKPQKYEFILPVSVEGQTAP